MPEIPKTVTTSYSGRPVPISEAPSRPSTVPEWFDDDRPTQRHAHLAATGHEVTAPSTRPMVTVLAGLDEGQVFTLDRAESLIGRGRDVHVGVNDIGVSRRHARIVRIAGPRYVLEDLGSKNGVFVNGREVDTAELADGDRLQVGPTLVLRFSFAAVDEEALAYKLYEGSTRDGLTRLFNRKYADERLPTEVAYARRHKGHFSLVLFDLDHFKAVNDTFGHPAGDGVLRVVAAQVRKALRVEDVLARYGGEEFVVLVRGLDLEGVGKLANRVRKGIERLSIPWELQTIRPTVSVGVASLSECTEPTVQALVALADLRLYQAKTAGRNRVC